MPYEFEKYSAVALRVYSIMHDLTPHVMGVSVDEAYLDVTALVGDPRGGGPAGGDGLRETATSLYLHENEKQHRGTAREVAETLRAGFSTKPGASRPSGSGPTDSSRDSRRCARNPTACSKSQGKTRRRTSRRFPCASSRRRPRRAREAQRRASAPERKDAPAVACRDVLRVPSDRLQRALGRKSALSLRDACRGIDRRDWVSRPPRKSVGAQVTWGVRFDEAREVVAFAAKLAGEVAARARKLKVKGRCLTVKVLRAVANVPDGMMKGSVGHGVCDHLTRSVTLSALCDGANALAREASAILAALAVPAGEIRGMGLQLSKLDSDPSAFGSRGAGPGLTKGALHPKPAGRRTEWAERGEADRAAVRRMVRRRRRFETSETESFSEFWREP